MRVKRHVMSDRGELTQISIMNFDIYVIPCTIGMITTVWLFEFIFFQSFDCSKYVSNFAFIVTFLFVYLSWVASPVYSYTVYGLFSFFSLNLFEPFLWVERDRRKCTEDESHGTKLGWTYIYIDWAGNAKEALYM